MRRVLRFLMILAVRLLDSVHMGGGFLPPCLQHVLISGLGIVFFALPFDNLECICWTDIQACSHTVT